jgi:hypothetical protein
MKRLIVKTLAITAILSIGIVGLQVSSNSTGTEVSVNSAYACIADLDC